MTSAKPLSRAVRRVRKKDRRQTAGGVEKGPLPQNWRSEFLAKLAETSNVRQSCEHAGVNPGTVYDLRRRDPTFAKRWLEALCEGYDNLEMEMLHHLRVGEGAANASKFNFAVALRMLLAHRETVGREKARRIDVSVEEIRASIERKAAQMRERVLARQARDAAEIEAAEAKAPEMEDKKARRDEGP
jgi:hypothetical protein